jgi:hypothetical protein
MIAVIEIMLTVAAWKRGWKGWALLPLGIGLLAAIWAGSVLASAGVSEEEIGGICFMLDGVAILALILMAAVGKRTQQKVFSQVQNTTTQNTVGQVLPANYSQNNISHQS